MTPPRSWFRQLKPPYPPAVVDDDEVVAICDDAIADLGTIRRLGWLGDAACELHLLASLIGHLQARLPAAVRDARDQQLTWDQIGDLLGISGAAARRRYHAHPTVTEGAPIDD